MQCDHSQPSCDDAECPALAPLVMQIFPVELLSVSLAVELRLAVKARLDLAGVKHSSVSILSCRQTFLIRNTFMQVV